MGKAVELTYSGLGSAFAVLAVLIVITGIVTQIERLRIRMGAASEVSNTATTPAAHRRASGVASPSTEPTLQSQQTAHLRQEVENETGGDDEEGSRAAAGTGDWKGFGKLEAFLSRRVGRRGG